MDPNMLTFILLDIIEKIHDKRTIYVNSNHKLWPSEQWEKAAPAWHGKHGRCLKHSSWGIRQN